MFKFNGRTPKKILYNNFNVAKLVYNGVVVWMSKVLATIEGILPLTLTNCTGDDLVDYKLYGNSEYEGLPDGYTQVEYLESTGTQYIDTGVKGKLNTEVIIKVNQVVASTQNTITVFGDNSNTSKAITTNFSTNTSTGRLQRFGNVSNTYATPLSLNTEYVFKTNKSGLYIDNTKIITFNTTIDFTTDNNMCIFKVRGINANYYDGTSRVYYCQIYEAGVLVRNFIPCINSSNVAGMYDTVNGVFYSNAGTGTFNVGSVVSKTSVGDLVTDTSDINYGKYKIPVLTNSNTTNIYLNKPLRRTSKLPYGYTELEHIRSTGTQYIDTGFKPNQDTKIDIKITRIAGGISNPAILGVSNPFYSFAINNNDFYYSFNQTGTNIKSTTFSIGETAIFKTDRGKLYKNGKLVNTLYTQNNFQSDLNLTLFARRTDNNTVERIGNMQIYYYKIYDNDVLVRNFIPCKNSSNVVGLYDTVNDVFYSNAGSGSFIAGAEVETVYYTDYLDYENQKVVRNVDDNYKGLDTPTEESVILPAVPTDEGTAIFDVDTEVKPSYAELKYYNKET